jgi:NAD(P)-dependent dehydrogenase (short-subunit alcohol dehydrogenase family)
MSSPKTWIITGTSRGFGRIWAEAALARGDRVVATARDPRALDPLVETYGDLVLPLALDVTDKAAVGAAFAAAVGHFGRLDVVVNNAGGGLLGAVEEVTEDEVRALFETNFFGALRVVKAAVPYLRSQGSGHILQISSIGGVLAIPTGGLYNASKWAMEAYSQALATEVGPFGVKVTLVEPGGYPTGWSSSATRATPMPEYQTIRDRHADSPVQTRPGDPAATAAAILELVDTPDPPLRAFLGDWLLPVVRAEYERRLATWEQWGDLARRAQGAAD